MRKVPAPRFAALLLRAAAIAFFIEAIGEGLWGAFLALNLRSTPAVPWAVVAEGVVLFALWRYAGGWGPPARSAGQRRIYRRANLVPVGLFVRACGAGLLALVAVAGWWIVLYRLISTSPNPLPDTAGLPPTTIVAVMLTAITAAPLTEEIAFRGYCQGMLERNARPVTAVTLVALLFALAHFPLGLAVSKFLVYFLVGLTLGAMVYLTDSILASLPVHALGDLLMFTLVWPYDAQRTLVTVSGTDMAFWLSLLQAVLFSGLALIAFVHVERYGRRSIRGGVRPAYGESETQSGPNTV
jgi:membrane protease YdiL (CAAX protease family)